MSPTRCFTFKKEEFKLTVLSEQGKEAVVAIPRARPVLWRRVMNGHPLRHRDDIGDGNCVITSHESRDDRRPS